MSKEKVAKLILIYSVALLFIISIVLSHLNMTFSYLGLIFMGFIWGFMANESFFNRNDSKDWVAPATPEGNTVATLSTIKTDYNRQIPIDPLPIDPPPFLCKKEENMNKETIRVSFTFDIDVGSELDEELEFLHAKAKHSRIKKLVEDHIREKIKDPVNNPDFLKDMKVNFSIPHSKTREQIITSMCFTYRHDYGILKNSSSISGMTEEERKFLWKQMSQIFDSDIAPYVDLKCFGK